MALYPELTTIAGLTAGITTPGDDEVVNKIPTAIRQVKHFLEHFLSISFNSDGTIKTTAVFTIPALGVSTAMLADNAVTTAKILNGNVTYEKLGASCVKTDNILNGTILGEDIAAGAITLTKLNAEVVAAWVAASTAATVAIANNTITAAMLKVPTTVPTTAAPAIPVLVGAAGAGSVMATIGGVLTATLTNGVLVFSLVGLSGAAGGGDTVTGQVAEFTTVTPATGATNFFGQTNTWLLSYSNLIVNKESTGALRVLAAGAYDVHWEIVWNGVGTAQSWLSTTATGTADRLAESSVATIGAGSDYPTTYSGVVTIAAANTPVYLWFVKAGSLAFVSARISLDKRA